MPRFAALQSGVKPRAYAAGDWRSLTEHPYLLASHWLLFRCTLLFRPLPERLAQGSRALIGWAGGGGVEGIDTPTKWAGHRGAPPLGSRLRGGLSRIFPDVALKSRVLQVRTRALGSPGLEGRCLHPCAGTWES